MKFSKIRNSVLLWCYDSHLRRKWRKLTFKLRCIIFRPGFLDCCPQCPSTPPPSHKKPFRGSSSQHKRVGTTTLSSNKLITIRPACDTLCTLRDPWQLGIARATAALLTGTGWVPGAVTRGVTLVTATVRAAGQASGGIVIWLSDKRSQWISEGKTRCLFVCLSVCLSVNTITFEHVEMQPWL